MYVSSFAAFRDFGFGTLDKTMSEMLWNFRDHLAETGIATSTINCNMFVLTRDSATLCKPALSPTSWRSPNATRKSVVDRASSTTTNAAASSHISA